MDSPVYGLFVVNFSLVEAKIHGSWECMDVYGLQEVWAMRGSDVPHQGYAIQFRPPRVLAPTTHYRRAYGRATVKC